MNAILPSTIFDLPEQEIKESGNGGKYHTGDELTFIRDMRMRNPQVCRNYCQLIIQNRRVYDSWIDLDRVYRFAHQTLAELPAGI